MTSVGFYVVIKALDIPVVFHKQNNTGISACTNEFGICMVSRHYEVHQSDWEMRSPFFQSIAIMSLWEELVSS